MTKEVKTARIAARLLVTFLLIGAIFFGTAGTLKWLEAWIYHSVLFCCVITMVVWMKKKDPVLLKDRMMFDKKSPKGVDRAILRLYFLFVCALLVIPGLDAVRCQWSSVPLFIKVIGFLAALFSVFVMFSVIRANPYLSTIVEVQEEKGQRTVTSGPYRFVRHPWYVALILWVFSIPLALGSLYALIPAAAIAILLVARVIIEEKSLQEELSGYKEYCTQIPYRLVPYIW